MKKENQDTFNLLACQVSIPVTENAAQRDQHVDRLALKVSEALSSGDAGLVVLPELSTIDYSRASFDHLATLAETLDGRTVSVMAALANKYGTAMTFGMPRKDQDRYFISQVVLDAAGELLGCYDKLHICQYGASMEKEYFQRGNNTMVFELQGFRFAPIICYDIRIPELSRILTIDQKVHCILHCGAYYRDESFATWHPFVTTRAMENQLYIVSLNRAGEGYGDSIFCPPWVDQNHPAELFDPDQEELRFLQIDRQRIVQVRAEYTFLADRLPDYAVLT